METVTKYLLFFATIFVAGILFSAFVDDGNAHLVTEPKTKTVAAINKSQTLNLSHARYVCNNGKNETKTWHCRASKGWLLKEWKESRDRLASQQELSYPWYQIATCESSLGTGAPQWHISTGNGFYGGLQFDYGTWHEAQDNLGVYWTEYAHQAAPWQQVRAAKTLPLTRWPHCGAPYR